MCEKQASTERPNHVNAEATFVMYEAIFKEFWYLCVPMSSSLTYFCGIAATVFIAVSLVIAAVRWFHMCRPFDRKPEYYYPGRPFVVGIYLNALILLPYVVHPDSPDAWYLVRIYFLPVTLYHFTIMLFAYFGTVMKWKKWRRSMFLVSLPLILIQLAAFVMAVMPGNQVGSVAPMLSWAVLYVAGILVSGVCLVALTLVLVWAGQSDADDYSNRNDFPVVTARRWVGMVVLNGLLCWVAVLSASQAMMGVVMMLFAGSSIVFIITALHPHRARPVEDEPVTCEEPACREPETPSRKQQSALEAIHIVMVEQKAYLDAHLTIQDVANRCGYSRSALSGLFRAQLGGFFNYVNHLRLQHVEAYLQEHPGAPLQEAILESGFNSRQAYYSVKARIK